MGEGIGQKQMSFCKSLNNSKSITVTVTSCEFYGRGLTREVPCLVGLLNVEGSCSYGEWDDVFNSGFGGL